MALSKIRNDSFEDTAVHGRRNLIINGACTISQRGTSFTDLANGQYGLDRFHISKITLGAVDIKQTDDAPTASQAGYLLTKCFHADVTTADASVAASDMYTIRQRVEYKNIAYVGFGQSGTRYVTASFWVKSTKTGTFCCYIKSDDHTRAYTKEYTVSASDTWEYKALTFPVDTSSTSSWDGTSTDTGAELGWTLYSGTDYHITADTWTTTSNNYAPCTSNQVNALDSASNDFKITGVQLELGEQATPFEHRTYGEELSLCQRYYHQTDLVSYQRYDASAYADLGSRVYTTPSLPQTMRATPTISQSGLTVDGAAVTSVANAAGNQRMSFVLNHDSSRTTRESYQVYPTGTASVKFDAEL